MVAYPWDREPADYLISVQTYDQLSLLLNQSWPQLVIRDKRVAYVEDDLAFYSYDAQVPGWIRIGSASVPPVGTLVDLGAIDASSLGNGTITYVSDPGDIYVLDTVNTYTPDGLTVIAATGGGYWVARDAGRWDDVQGSIANGAGAGLLTLEFFRDTRFNMYFMRHDQNDELNFVYQLTHRWMYGTDVKPHLHVVAMANPGATQNVYVTGYYAWSRPNYASQIPALAGWTTFQVAVPIDPGDVYTQKIVSLGSWTPPAWARESTCLLIYFQRNGTNPLDTYTTNKDHGTPAANLGLLSTDVHYRLAQSGTVTEIPT